MAEIGDVRRFPRRSSIVGFAGVDPAVDDSGKHISKSNPTTKREKFLRGWKKGIRNWACKRGFFADWMKRRYQRQLILRKLPGISGNEALLDPCVVNAQELVLGGGHVLSVEPWYRS